MLSLSRRATLRASLAILAASCTPGLAPRRFARTQAVIDRYVMARKVSGAVLALKHASAPTLYLQAGAIALDHALAADDHTIYRIY